MIQLDADEVVGRELYEMYRESHDDPDFPTWDEALEYSWEAEFDDEGNELHIDVHEYWIGQGRRVNEAIARHNQRLEE